MVSDAARKKWGTIFMGNREATMEQLDAMQEPVLRDRVQRDQEKDYLERVRKRASERAREILEEAYTERQKIVQDAQAEMDALRQEQIAEGAKIRNEAQKIREAAQKELERARSVGLEADSIRDRAHGEGYSAGMDQAGRELKEFRADMGNEMAELMRAVEKQIAAITAFWRNDLAELVRQAVQSATGWVLESEHTEIITALVFRAVNLLEQRTVVTLRVNPDDEAIVSDLFCAARERAPELRQWIVQGDAAVERGGIYAESGSGSVDLRRQNFRELVDGILEHLTLPVRETEKEAVRQLHEQVEEKARRLEAVPQDHEEAAAQASEPGGGEPVQEAQVDLPDEVMQPLPDPVPVPQANTADPLQSPKPREPKAQKPQVLQDAPAEEDRSDSASHAALERELIPDDLVPPDFALPDDVFQLENAAGETKPAAEEGTAEQAAVPDAAETAAQPAEPEAAEPVDPDSLAFLEEELFPVGEDAESEVLANGGFLPEREQ